jgi:hypothetical protein
VSFAEGNGGNLSTVIGSTELRNNLQRQFLRYYMDILHKLLIPYRFIIICKISVDKINIGGG